MPFFREFKDGRYAFGGRPFAQLLILICAVLFDPALLNSTHGHECPPA
jgi:hypothetical protein